MDKRCRILILLLSLLCFTAYADASLNYVLLNRDQYRHQITNTRLQIQTLLTVLKRQRGLSTNHQVALIADQLADVPYQFDGGVGEGDWQPSALSYQPGAMHINQNPVYRVDIFNCQTFVQVAMALLHANNLAQFEQHILQIAYGAAGNPGGEIVHYYNRNNFVDGDFNPINHKNGRLLDVTTTGKLSAYAKMTSANITRNNFFLQQQKKPAEIVYVLSTHTALLMLQRLKKIYGSFTYPQFNLQKVSLSYLPKQLLALPQGNGQYQLNTALFAKIPTPAVMEIVSDNKNWFMDTKNMRAMIGSETNVTHMGLLYRKKFYYGNVIYHKITCRLDNKRQKICEPVAIICRKTICDELMFVHATELYPAHYYWYQKADGNYTCAPNYPTDGRRYTTCNRVERLPLFDYLTNLQYGRYSPMNNPSILGIHIEKLI